MAKEAVFREAFGGGGVCRRGSPSHFGRRPHKNQKRPQKLSPIPLVLLSLLAWSLLSGCEGKPLPVRLSSIPYATTLTPLETVTHSERFTRFSVTVSGFESKVDINHVWLEISPVKGLSFQIESNIQAGEKIFEIIIHYDGTTAFPEGSALVEYNLTNVPKGYQYSGEPQTNTLSILDGQTKDRRIPLRSGNLKAFNSYANTEEGRKLHYRLAENVELPEPLQNESNWTAIGTLPSPFLGSLDGGGFSISGLVIHRPAGDYQGLFGRIDLGATIENLELKGGSVIGKEHVGSVLGYNNGGAMHNCHADSVSVSGKSYVGGVLGTNNGDGTVANCHSTGNVSGSGDYVGGVVGYSYNGTVANCHSTGDVIGGSYVGGVVGDNRGAVQNSYATGNVSDSDSDSDSYVGGVVGLNHGTVQHSHATGDVSGNNYYVGGVVGRNYGTVANSYATGDVSGDSYYVGGVVGRNDGTVQNSYATGNVNGSSWYVGGVAGLNYRTVQDSYATGNVSGTIRVGGVVGWNGRLVKNSYATGSISGTNDVGGVVGCIYDGTVQDCVALNSSISARINSTSYIGRVVGYLHNNEYTNNTLSNNHARSNMALTYDNDSSSYTPTDDADLKDGETTFTYDTPTFWRETMHWNFETVWEWGPNNLPILQRVGGTQNHSVQ